MGTVAPATVISWVTWAVARSPSSQRGQMSVLAAIELPQCRACGDRLEQALVGGVQGVQALRQGNGDVVNELVGSGGDGEDWQRWSERRRRGSGGR